MTSIFSPMLLCDFYKVSHRAMYPKGTEHVYSTWTPRTSRIPGIQSVVSFGQQQFIKKYLIEFFEDNFFGVPKDEILANYSRLITSTLGVKDPDTSHISALYDLGYLPISIKSIPEGTEVPIKTPILTMVNTHPSFFWLTNYLETLMSCELWQAMTSASIANEYRKVLNAFANMTVGEISFVPFQGHDFSMRGMSSLDSAASSGMGHLLSFVGTDTIPAIQAAEHYYGAGCDGELVGTSIPASEHSIQCAFEDDTKYLTHLIETVHPSGLVSVVSDGYDFWDVIGRVIPSLKDMIMSRDGKVVIRPDSGDPEKIICGDMRGKTHFERMGAVQALWNIFGGTINSKGYKQLDSHIGLIYGDAITLDRCRRILSKLEILGFASTNVVFGVGSFTYQYNTRDTFGFALKSTLCVIDGVEKQIFKNPKTDDGTKKSQKGRVAVDPLTMKFTDGHSLAYNGPDALVEIFRDGKLIVNESFQTIRDRLGKSK